MAITASGLFGLTLEKMLIDTAGQSLEAETHKTLMVTNTFTPNYDTMDFRDDVTNEVSGTGYTAGGNALTTTELTIASGSLTFDAADTTWSSSTITNARGAIHYFNVGTAATDQLVYLLNFGSDVSTTNGLFTIQYHATGIFIVDFSP